MKLVSIEKVGKKKVFDITVKDQHHYIIGNGIITHNSGGGGLKYAASIIVFLSKSKKRESSTDNTVVGAIITVKVDKSRFTREEKKVQTLLDHTTGLNKYYGLLEIAEVGGVVKKVSTKYQFPNGKTAFESVIYKNPETWFTKDVLDAIDVAAGNIFKYGAGEVMPTEETEDETPE